MNNLINAIVNLIKIKSIISIAVVFTACYMTIKGDLDVASFMALASAIITYYFTKDKRGGEE